MTGKKYGGVIHNWKQVNMRTKFLSEYLFSIYGPNLGFVIAGDLRDDPTGRFGRGPIRTSLVVKFRPATGYAISAQIETLNTIYDLGEPA